MCQRWLYMVVIVPHTPLVLEVRFEPTTLCDFAFAMGEDALHLLVFQIIAFFHVLLQHVTQTFLQGERFGIFKLPIRVTVEYREDSFSILRNAKIAAVQYFINILVSVLLDCGAKFKKVRQVSLAPSFLSRKSGVKCKLSYLVVLSVYYSCFFGIASFRKRFKPVKALVCEIHYRLPCCTLDMVPFVYSGRTAPDAINAVNGIANHCQLHFTGYRSCHCMYVSVVFCM